MIHLDECLDTHISQTTAVQVSFIDATKGGSVYADMCPDVEYMRDELYPDELVWVRTP